MQQQEIVPHLICMAGSVIKSARELSPKKVVRSQRVPLERGPVEEQEKGSLQTGSKARRLPGSERKKERPFYSSPLFPQMLSSVTGRGRRGRGGKRQTLLLP